MPCILTKILILRGTQLVFLIDILVCNYKIKLIISIVGQKSHLWESSSEKELVPLLLSGDVSLIIMEELMLKKIKNIMMLNILAASVISTATMASSTEGAEPAAPVSDQAAQGLTTESVEAVLDAILVKWCNC